MCDAITFPFSEGVRISYSIINMAWQASLFGFARGRILGAC